ncbi:MAG: FlgD immunoglobulin-like domain containing protein, partial [Candidatus Poribacteria bacterium]
LRVIDVSNPQNPVEVGFYDTLGDANDVYVSESYAYVADGDSGLRVIDVSSPENPVEVGFYDTPGSAFCVYVSGSYAYVADYDRGLRVIDVSAPQNPFEVGFYDTSGEANGVYVSGGLIYVADGFGGLYILRYTGGEPFYGDGNITAYDAALILQVVVGILNLGDTEYLTLERADVTGNGTVSALDAALVLQYTVGLITEFPCQQPAGAPTLNLEAEPKLLAEAIEQIESVTLSKEGQQVLEILKRLVPKPISQNRTADAVGLSTALFQNFPNPFNPDTWLPYQIARDAPVTISIYDAKGQLIRTLDLGNQKAGVYVTENRAAYWDGRDNAGEKVASGVYFYTLRVGDFTTTRKMAILK